jgi:hypothetical protein
MLGGQGHAAVQGHQEQAIGMQASGRNHRQPTLMRDVAVDLPSHVASYGVFPLVSRHHRAAPEATLIAKALRPIAEQHRNCAVRRIGGRSFGFRVAPDTIGSHVVHRPHS